MSIDVIGAITFVVGLMILWLRPGFGVYALTISTVFGASAAVKLPALDNASIPPSPVLLGFVTIAAVLNGPWRRAAMTSLAFPRPGFWFLVLAVYGALSAFFLPRIFSDLTHVYSIARSATSEKLGFVTLSLAPRASNITQPFYFIGNLFSFALIAGYMRLGGGPLIIRALLSCSFLMLFFVILDFATYATNTSEILAVIKNANYRILEGEIAGLKRVVGSFSETSAYCYTALGLYAFNLGLWLEKYPTRFAAPLAVLLLITLLISTSSTAYAALALFSFIILGFCLWNLFTGRASQRQIIYIFILIFIVPFLVMTAMMIPAVWDTVMGLLDDTVVNKLGSQSGLERMRWNTQALISFMDTSGFGAGLGSVRASSFVVAILGNLGVVGLCLFIAFLGGVALPRRNLALPSPVNATGWSAAAACLSLIIAASVSSGSVDLGMSFSIYAGLSAASRFGGSTAVLRSTRTATSPWNSPLMVRPV